MYMAFGWPQVIPLESTAAAATSSSPSFDRIVYLKVINRHLLVVSPTHLELWSSSQHKVRLGKYVRDADSVERHGENLQAIWSPDTKSIAVLVWYPSPGVDPFKREDFLQVIAKLEGPAVSQYCALRLLQATLDESLYELAGELVLVDLFRHDLRLWTAYSRTLQSHPSFHNYLDLLDVLEEQLASVSDLDIQNGPAASSDHSSE
ncbi:RIC1 [Musa troglodytarum]|uniref:RIC1 n=1 Tax=Musa troglodytarum TaxID=320322 RepID=A0A9E7EYB0_9LILI|nr:RIC1 [Musa troglodytarum]